MLAADPREHGFLHSFLQQLAARSSFSCPQHSKYRSPRAQNTCSDHSIALKLPQTSPVWPTGQPYPYCSAKRGRERGACEPREPTTTLESSFCIHRSFTYLSTWLLVSLSPLASLAVPALISEIRWFNQSDGPRPPFGPFLSANYVPFSKTYPYK
jgi:hypothetical protein